MMRDPYRTMAPLPPALRWGATLFARWRVRYLRWRYPVRCRHHGMLQQEQGRTAGCWGCNHFFSAMHRDVIEMAMRTGQAVYGVQHGQRIAMRPLPEPPPSHPLAPWNE